MGGTRMAHDDDGTSERNEQAPPLPYRAAADDRKEDHADYADKFRRQMWVGIGVGLPTTFLWGATNLTTSTGAVGFNTLFFGSILAVWAVVSIVRYRTSGFVVGVVLAVASAFLITGCGAAVICSGIR